MLFRSFFQPEAPYPLLVRFFQPSAASIRQSAAVSDLRFAACDIQALVLQSAVSGQPPAASSQKQSAICDLQPWCSGKQGSSSMRTKSPDAGDLPLRPGQFRNRDGTNKDKKKSILQHNANRMLIQPATPYPPGPFPVEYFRRTRA